MRGLLHGPLIFEALRNHRGTRERCGGMVYGEQLDGRRTIQATPRSQALQAVRSPRLTRLRRQRTLRGLMVNRGSAIWVGAALGLLIGLALGFVTGSYWTTVLYAVLIGAATGLAANSARLLTWARGTSQRPGTQLQAIPDRKPIDLPPMPSAPSMLEGAERVLRQHAAADFATTRKAEEEANEVVLMVEEKEWWRASYDSVEAFYSAHEGRHPDIRAYAERALERHPDTVPYYD